MHPALLTAIAIAIVVTLWYVWNTYGTPAVTPVGEVVPPTVLVPAGTPAQVLIPVSPAATIPSQVIAPVIVPAPAAPAVNPFVPIVNTWTTTNTSTIVPPKTTTTAEILAKLTGDVAKWVGMPVAQMKAYEANPFPVTPGVLFTDAAGNKWFQENNVTYTAARVSPAADSLDGTVKYLGTTADRVACGVKCAASPGCVGYTWNPPGGGSYPSQCFGANTIITKFANTLQSGILLPRDFAM